MLPSATKKNFLIFWLSGWALFCCIVALEPPQPPGITGFDMEAHRMAGSAETVNTIHAYWQGEGVYNRALWSLVVDMLFITAISIGGILGGRLLQQNEAKTVRFIGLVAIAAHAVFWLVDYGETLSQLVQMVHGQGYDILAGIAAFMRPIKLLVFLIGFLALVIGYGASRILSTTGQSKP
ncbi:hypothetical protein [Alterisphingorhabdus coralli]|uniref:Uncharacterized protein n=1 Tax=Alterisphingorhabdus coralli TaxID=3071408 RepID=A0AA97I1A8_9SPHN|nr:hypothetical protein [Parasphingorhabdus sp. SCSIO 66989]WOE76549.1 hypothetical protein RB602_07500 [Parasphingorhabdus sp. SCSIO 66989]